MNLITPASNTEFNVFLREFAWVGLGVTYTLFSTVGSIRRVAEARKKFSISPPATDAPKNLSEEDKQTWLRTYRAQINSIEWMTLTVPMMVTSGIIGYAAIGKWAPRLVGIIGILNGYFRQQYVKGYIEAAEKREQWFGYTLKLFRPLLFFTVATCTFVISRDFYQNVLKEHIKALKA